jgi:hypothetical protein
VAAHHILEVVCHEHGRHVERAAHGGHFVLQVTPHRPVHRGIGFIEQQHGRLARQRARQRHPLLLAAREFVRPAPGLALQMYLRETRIGPCLPFAARPSVNAAATLPPAVRCGKSA